MVIIPPSLSPQPSPEEGACGFQPHRSRDLALSYAASSRSRATSSSVRIVAYKMPYPVPQSFSSSSELVAYLSIVLRVDQGGDIGVAQSSNSMLRVSQVGTSGEAHVRNLSLRVSYVGTSVRKALGAIVYVRT
ncbi:hypothetical protein Tco_0044448 [Tanacetum coccineum]